MLRTCRPSERRPEEVCARAAAEIHTTLPEVFEPAGADDDVTRSTFRLDPAVAAVAEHASLDDALMASHHVNPRPAPSLDRAVLDPKVFEPREFDAVVIAFRQVADVDSLERDVVRWLG